jgi:hypothetical protein
MTSADSQRKVKLLSIRKFFSAPLERLAVKNFRVLSQDLSAGKCQIEATNTLEMDAISPARGRSI